MSTAIAGLFGDCITVWGLFKHLAGPLDGAGRLWRWEQREDKAVGSVRRLIDGPGFCGTGRIAPKRKLVVFGVGIVLQRYEGFH